MDCIFSLFIGINLATFVAAIHGDDNQVAESSDFYTAAKAGNIDALHRHFIHGVDVHKPDQILGVTSLAWATISGHTAAVRLLLENGADVNAKNRDGATPLHAAAFLGHAEIVKLLIENGADVNAKNNDGIKPISTIKADWVLTQRIAEILQIEVDPQRVKAGRKKAAEILYQHGAKEDKAGLPLLLGIIAFITTIVVAIGVIVSVVACCLLSSALQALPQEHRQLESWQLWFLVLPCFNIVWNFFVFPKISRSFASYFRSRGRTDIDGSSRLGFCYCICCAGGWIPIVNQVAALAGLTLLVLYLVKIDEYKKQVISDDIRADLESPTTASPRWSAANTTPAPRHHDLDALRAIAMLLGIALHASLSLTPFPWPVQDHRQHELFGIFFAAVHGFRMPTFFLLSGFFTAMLWRRRGLQALIWHRFRRVFLPCMAGLFTIVPAVNGTIFLIAITTADQTAETTRTAMSKADKEDFQFFDKAKSSEDEDKNELAKTLWFVAMLLMYAPVFHHLWFLWFLCWLVTAFALFAAIADRWNWAGPPPWLILSPTRYFWLLPLTMLPQSLMGLKFPSFGPDTSTGILPAPHILLYYAIFFGFGSLYFECGDEKDRLGKWWPIGLPLGLLIIFPLGLDFSFGVFGFREQLVHPSLYRPMAIALQVIYAWTMTFGLIGLFRKLLTRENRTFRYLSDASYWLYLAHLPLIFISQAVVRTWPLPPLVKFLFVCGTVTGLLLFLYQTIVRHTWLGTFLNGPPKQPELTDPIVIAKSLEG